MKKKSQRVPDFSTKRPGAKPGPMAPGAIAPGAKAKPAPVPPVPTIKPQATSSKSGHRGG